MTPNQQIDECLRIRRQALIDLEQSLDRLLDMGVRFFSDSEDGVPEIEAAQDLTERYEQTLEDFEWKAVYKDGSEIDQYGETEHHFGDIDQSKLKQMILISNFEIDTSNLEKRLIITLDFETGTFQFLNCGPLAVRDALTTPVEGDKKLIFFCRRRQDFTAGVDAENGKLEPTGEKIVYNRYFLGFESKDKKTIICAYPNGEVAIENA